MTIKQRLLLFFGAYITVIVIVVAGVSVYVLERTISLILGAENMTYAAIMGQRIAQKAVIGYGLMVLAILVVTVPAGILLSRFISGAYLRIFGSLTRMASDRLHREPLPAVDESERARLQRYIDVLVADQERLRESEKMGAWKDGARLLMHELKNPLTPLKLSAESLSLIRHDSEAVQAEVRGILTATRDVEQILAVFKDLVNIEFGPRGAHALRPLLEESFAQLRATHGNLAVQWEIGADEIMAVTEPTLLKMLLANLVNNGMEANSEGFHVEVKDAPGAVLVECVTPERTITHPARIFRLNYSERGEGRGYGLFLGRLISDYLDLGLRFEQRDADVVFSLRLPVRGSEMERADDMLA
jgi:signal transduction histidine kinase